MMKLRVPTGDSLRTPDSRPLARPEFVRAGLAAETLKTLGELKGRCGRLVDAGLVQVAELWARLPKVRVDVAREGRQLKLELSASTIDARTGDLVRRSCIWYAGVQRMAARAHGRVVDPRVAEVEDVLMDYRPPEDEPPRGATEALVTAVLILNDVVGDMRSDLSEVKADVTDLKTGQDNLRADVEVLKGDVGRLTGGEFEERARGRMKRLLHRACRERGLVHPQTVELWWSDRADVPAGADWEEMHRRLGLAPDSGIETCDFIYRIAWPAADSRAGRIPPLLLVGEVTVQVDARVLAKVAGHAHDLAHRAPQYREAFPARTVVCGDRFTNEADVRDGPAAVARAGAAFVNMPEDKDARRSTVDGLADVLQEWTART